MKVNDLMVGDLVSRKGKPVRVLAINEGNGCCVSFGDGWCGEAVDLLEPIPLTPEILEKNGFIKGDTMDLGDEIYCVKLFNIHYDNEEREFWVCNFFESEYGTREMMDIFRIDYVHELQHALRLCKVDKEIVL